MRKRLLLAASVVLSIPLVFVFVRPSVAGQVVCNPLCAPTFDAPSSADNHRGHRKDNDHRGQGLRHANDVAGEHGFEGRDNARLKQDAHRPGGSGVPDPTPVPAPVPVPAPAPTPDPTTTGTTTVTDPTLTSPPTITLSGGL
jgi:hypothetical protein